MKAKYLLFTVWLMITGNLSSQNSGQELSDRINYIFQQTDKSRITTGLLSDYGLQIVEPVYFDGIPADSNYVDMDTWKMLYSGIYTSKINNNISLTSPETVFSQIENTAHTTAVPVAMMHYQYNQLNENALNLGLLQVVNDRIIDIPGAASPYLTKQLFAVAPKELFFNGSTVGFVFKSNLWYTNSGKTIRKREINFNNESGYLTAAWDTPISYMFSTGGVKTIYFRLTYTDGTFYTSQTNIMVTISSSSFRSSTEDGDFPIQATSQHSGGTIQVRLSTYNSEGEIKKPLIVAEGFDVSSIMSIENRNVDDFIDTQINVPYPGGSTLYDRIDLAQFDIIYLDYNNGVDDIWRNAQLFKEVIQYVNSNKVGNEPNVVMGISMGGLVARIALRQMEMAGQNHQTSKYISVDSPHKGANVPVGFQAAVRHIQNTNLEIFFINVFDYTKISQIKGAVDLLNSTAAKQMLIYTINSSYNFDNSVHNTFQQAYDQLGFPQQCRNIAISNGSNNGSLSFAPGSAIIDWQYSYSFKWWVDILALAFGQVAIHTNYPYLAFLNHIPGSSQVRVELNVDALKDQSASRIYKGVVRIRRKILLLVNVDINITEKTISGTSSMLPIDGAPGGLYSMDMMGGNLPFPASAVKQSQFCFVPTVSALALTNWQTELTQNLSRATTPFYRTFTQGDNELHTRFNSPAQFLYNQLADISPITILGADIICSTAAYTLGNLPSNISGSQVTWSCSSDLQIIGGNTGLQKYVKVVSPDDGYGWIEVNANNQISRRNIQYFIANESPYISGPSNLTVGNISPYTLYEITDPVETYFPSEYPYGYPSCNLINWTCSSNLMVTYEDPMEEPEFAMSQIEPDFPDEAEIEYSVAATVSALAAGTGWIKAHINVNGDTLTVMKYVNVTAVTPPSSISVGIVNYWYYFHANTSPAATSYEWKCNSNVIGHNVNICYIPESGNSSTMDTLKVTVSNGTISGECQIMIPGGLVFEEEEDLEYIACFPNPASGILNITLDMEKYKKSINYQTMTGTKLTNTPTFDIRLYNDRFILQQQFSMATQSKQINVSTWQSGHYFIVVSDGKKSIIKHIVIKK
jgi:hypothetical protein